MAIIEGKEAADGTRDQTTCGLWSLASRINHSCVTNCRRSFIGDMMIVRASKDMEAGTELHFQYQTPEPNETFDDTQKKFSNWGFVCSCALCLAKKRTPKHTIREREARYRSLEPILKPGASLAQLARARKIVDDMEKTYTTREDTPPLPCLELWDAYFIMGCAFMEKGKLTDALEMFLKELEAQGFIILACPPRGAEGEGNADKKKPTLEIKHWGYVIDNTVEALSQMHRAYASLAPELCKVVKEYAGVAYSICVGEKETILKRYPGLS